MKGFEPQKKQRQYWLQITYNDDRPDEWIESFVGNRPTFRKAANLIRTHGDEIAFILILHGALKKGAIAKDHHIIHDLQSDPFEGAKKLK